MNCYKLIELFENENIDDYQFNEIFYDENHEIINIDDIIENHDELNDDDVDVAFEILLNEYEYEYELIVDVADVDDVDDLIHKIKYIHDDDDVEIQITYIKKYDELIVINK